MNERTVLILDNEGSFRTALVANFCRLGWKAECAGGVREALSRLRNERFRLLITDVHMQDGDGLDVMRGAQKFSPGTAVILLAASGSIPEAVAAVKEGAIDYIVKPISFHQLMGTVNRVMQGERRSAKSAEIIGSSKALLEAIGRATQVARTDADVLIQAESGTGKELLAKLIHRTSNRRDHAFVAINCAAVPENLLESELFGHIRGAFTGAVASKQGKFALAHGGTLLLDEIGEMPLNLQPKLLRALQEREIEPLGDTRTVKVDIRVVATTNRSLQTLVAEGKFRSDLYYRLNVIPLNLPALRERKGDIAELARYFVNRFSSDLVSAPTLTEEFIAGLERYAWPGNIRELSNFIRRVVALCSSSEIGGEYLDPAMTAEVQRAPDSSSQFSPGLSLREVERRVLEAALNATDGNRTRAARMLGISIRTVRNKIRDYGLAKGSYA